MPRIFRQAETSGRPLRVQGLLVRLSNGETILGIADYVGYIDGAHRSIDRAIAIALERLKALPKFSKLDAQRQVYLWAGELEFVYLSGDWVLSAGNEVSGWRHAVETVTGVRVNNIEALSEYLRKNLDGWIVNRPKLEPYDKDRILAGKQSLHFDDEINQYSMASLRFGNKKTFNHDVNSALNSFFAGFASALDGETPMSSALLQVQKDSPLMLMYVRKVRQYSRRPPDTGALVRAIAKLFGVVPPKGGIKIPALEHEIATVSQLIESIPQDEGKKLVMASDRFIRWLRGNDQRPAPVELFLSP